MAEQIASATGFALPVMAAPQGDRPVIAFVLDKAAAALGADFRRFTQINVSEAAKSAKICANLRPTNVPGVIREQV